MSFPWSGLYIVFHWIDKLLKIHVCKFPIICNIKSQMNIKVKVTLKNREMLIQNRKLFGLLEKSNLLVIEVKGKLKYGSIGYIKLNFSI